MQMYCELADKLWRELCVIPAPSHHEERRAKYIYDTLVSWGIDAEIDGMKNVIVRFDGENSETVVFAAHIDVVFPDTDSLPFSEDKNNVYCPGCGDDTAEVAMLLTVVKYIADSGKKPENTVLIVFNTCEEIGNFGGTTAIFEKYGKNIKEFYTFDGTYDEVVNESVGIHRYKVTVKTEGGHAYQNFGNKNAAEILARGIARLYDIKAPQENSKTTYNVGMISGGTSVNSICQTAEMLCEYRSAKRENILYIKEKFGEVIGYMKSFGGEVTAELLSDIPCMKNVNKDKMREMTDFCKEIQKKHTGLDVIEASGSTDCNIPHSLGIPAVCVGAYMGGGIHSRGEWAEKASIQKGLNIVKDIVMHYFK